MRSIIKFYIVILFCACATAKAQNLVPNPGFENNSGCPTSTGQWPLCNNWDNVNKNPTLTWPYATPDYLHTCGSGQVGLPNTVFGTINAYSGNACYGLVAKHGGTADFREYVSCQLTSPMVVGTTYTVGFHIINATVNPYSDSGCDRFGIHFSTAPLSQLNHEPINVIPQVEWTTMSFFSNWTLVQWTFTATQPFSTITIGNFRDDANTQMQSFISGGYSAAYFFLDEVFVQKSGCAISATVNQSNLLCKGNNDGSAAVSVTAGSSPFTYMWFPSGNTTSAITGLTAGTYSVVASDAGGCSTSQIITITEPSALTAAATYTSATCGNNNGIAMVTANGGAPGYIYSWSSTPVQTTQSATGLPAGTYIATVTDINGCTATQTVSITQGTLAAPVTASSANCTTSGTASVTPSGGSSPYTYSWSSGETNAIITGLNPGSYSVNVTDANGCTATNTVSITSSGSVTALASPNTTICTGQTSTLTASGGANYSWSTGETTTSIAATVSATYSVIVSTGSCADTAFIKLSVSPPPVAAANSTTICEGEEATLTASGGTSYSWNTGSTTNSLLISPATTSAYSVVVSVGSCSATATSTVVVNPRPVATAASDVTITAGASTTLTASGGGNYLWSNGTPDSLITVSPATTTIYCVVVSNANNCTDTACITVMVEPGNCPGAEKLYLPDAFSPNGDGENDVLEIYFGNKMCIKTFKLELFGRWGEKIFETGDPDFKWPGVYKSADENTIVYTYFMHVTFISGEQLNKKGNISLIK